MADDRDFEDFYTSSKEKLAPFKGRPPKSSNWTSTISIISGLALWGLFVFLYTEIYPNRDLNLLVIATAFYFVFLIYFLVYSIFGIYHMIRFGFEGDLSTITTILYVIISAALVYSSFILIF